MQTRCWDNGRDPGTTLDNCFVASSCGWKMMPTPIFLLRARYANNVPAVSNRVARSWYSSSLRRDNSFGLILNAVASRPSVLPSHVYTIIVSCQKIVNSCLGKLWLFFCLLQSRSMDPVQVWRNIQTFSGRDTCASLSVPRDPHYRYSWKTENASFSWIIGGDRFKIQVSR